MSSKGTPEAGGVFSDNWGKQQQHKTEERLLLWIGVVPVCMPTHKHTHSQTAQSLSLSRSFSLSLFLSFSLSCLSQRGWHWWKNRRLTCHPGHFSSFYFLFCFCKWDGIQKYWKVTSIHIFNGVVVSTILILRNIHSKYNYKNICKKGILVHFVKWKPFLLNSKVKPQAMEIHYKLLKWFYKWWKMWSYLQTI